MLKCSEKEEQTRAAQAEFPGQLPKNHPPIIGLAQKEVEQSSDFGSRNQCCVRDLACGILRNTQSRAFFTPPYHFPETESSV
jgi:hypothetical protein